MNRTLYALAAALSVAALSAHAESPDRSGQFAPSFRSATTRAQVLADLKEAQRTGDVLAAGEQGGTLYERNPSAYPQRVMLAGKSRDEVRAETLQAIQDGDIIHGELGLPRRELFPEVYMARGRSGQHMAGVPLVPVAPAQ